MGPINDPSLNVADVAARLAKEKEVANLLEYLVRHPRDTAGFTASGRVPTNPVNSGAKLGSIGGEFLGAAEGKTLQKTAEMAAAKNAEVAILEALQALAQKPQYPQGPPRPPTPIPSELTPATGGQLLMRLLNKLALGVDLATTSTDLNTGEAERLKILKAGGNPYKGKKGYE